MAKYSIIIPAYNEEEGVKETVLRAYKSNPEAEIIVVDDGSTDKTWTIINSLKKDRIRVYKHKKNMGKAHALQTGYSHAKTGVLVTIDADRTYLPEEIPGLVEEFVKKSYDMLVGTRFKKGFPKKASLLRSLANIAGSAAASIVLMKRVTDLTSGLRVMNRKVSGIKVKARNLEYEAEITSRVVSKKLKYGESPINVEEREGKSKLNFVKNCCLFLRAIFAGKFEK